MRPGTLRGIGWALLAASTTGCGAETVNPVPTVDPGALVAVSVSSRVGFVLDEIPLEERDRVADALAALDEQEWLARARQQLKHTSYRLIFREYYFLGDDLAPIDADGDGRSDRLNLPLPPESLWQLTLDASPTRVEIDGHDIVAAPYSMQSVIVTDAASPGMSEPNLAEVGGVWEEPFVLPVDPELVFQRTGYACANEFEYPPGSVDTENFSAFYDDTCPVETTDALYCHTATTLVDESCVEALERKIGRVETALRFERIPYDGATAEAFRLGEVVSVGTPELAPSADALQENRVVYRYFPQESCAIYEGCVGGSGWRRLLQFTGSVHNVGMQPLHIGAVDYFVGGETGDLENHNLYEYSACHNHYHFTHYGDFGLDTGSAPVGGKRAWCLVSTSRASNNEVTPLFTPYSDCVNQGIQAGWSDEYYAGLDCQWLDITDVDTSAGPTTASLSFDFNPDQFLCEGYMPLDEDGRPFWEPALDENGEQFTTSAGEPVDKPVCEPFPGSSDNNRVAIDVSLPAEGGLITEPCSRGQIGPLRNCGWSAEGQVTPCTPGAEVKVSCRADGAEAQAVRVCEASLGLAKPPALGARVPCAVGDALANVTLGSAATEVSFICPSARDTTEYGGLFALYAAAIYPADGDAAITCTPVAP